MRLRFLISLLAALACLGMAAKPAVATTVPGDPMATQCYTLSNGLKVFLSVNHQSPRISAHIAVRTGSRNDPAETTGLAHYLEHLMFKGTQQFGTSNYAAEKALLDTIEARYEQYRLVKDPERRRVLYHEIDSISQLAAQYNIPNEYDKLMAGIGGQGTNAYTSTDVTCYTEDIPANEVDRWARIQADRFQNMVIRGFHTELEAVYEEYNIGIAQDQRKIFEAMSAKLFPTHPYGTQTTIGTQEHLKNPSITNIKNYFHNYYCPNNVAICMAGDFDPNEVIAILERHFGSWKPNNNLYRPEFAPLKPIMAPVDTTVIGQEAEFVALGWRFDAGNSLQCDTLDLVSEMLSNGTAGLIDLNLNQPLKVMGAGAFADPMTDYSMLMLMGYPNEGQTLEEVRELLLGELAKLRAGDFDDDLLVSVVNNNKLNYLRALDSNGARTRQLVNAFINHVDWAQEVGKLDRMAGMTKQQIVDFANRHLLDNNFVCVYKRMGVDTTEKKIDKPTITPIPTNRDKQSDFVRNILSEIVEPIQPQFVDYSKEMTVGQTSKKLPLLYKHNDLDDLFTLTYKYDFGATADNRYETALGYMDYLGTKKMSATEFKQRLYKLACNISMNVSDNETYLTLSGLSENMPEALKLAEDLMQNAQVDEEAYKSMVDVILKSRNDAKSNQDECFSRLNEYGMYGPRNEYTNIMSEQQLRDTKPAELINLVKGLRDMQHTVVYYGPMTEKELNKCLSKVHKTKKNLAAVPVGTPYMEQTTPRTEILLAPYEAKNIYMVQYHNEGTQWAPEHAATINLFNEYFGGGMNGIVFQELREARGLAYSAAAYYRQPHEMGHPEYAMTYIITQNDKMMDCVREFNNIVGTIPQSEAAFALAKESLMKKLASRRTVRSGVLNSYIAAKRLGLDYDINSVVFNALPNLKLNDIVKFEQQSMANKPYRYLILGDEKELDIKALEKIGPIHRLTLEEIFGY
ncbi:MAG: insulinase family protein [Muribaculaceae bacterium]|nr:insulinase family protein [Muribaculaceae bacterium]